jgi:hypothetical protein
MSQGKIDTTMKLTRDEHTELILDIVKELTSLDYNSINIEGIGTIYSDIGDVGNSIGVVVGKHLKKHNIDKHDFLNGIRHGISLIDGTHG